MRMHVEIIFPGVKLCNMARSLLLYAVATWILGYMYTAFQCTLVEAPLLSNIQYIRIWGHTRIFGLEFGLNNQRSGTIFLQMQYRNGTFDQYFIEIEKGELKNPEHGMSLQLQPLRDNYLFSFPMNGKPDNCTVEVASADSDTRNSLLFFITLLDDDCDLSLQSLNESFMLVKKENERLQADKAQLEGVKNQLQSDKAQLQEDKAHLQEEKDLWQIIAIVEAVVIVCIVGILLAWCCWKIYKRCASETKKKNADVELSDIQTDDSPNATVGLHEGAQGPSDQQSVSTPESEYLMAHQNQDIQQSDGNEQDYETREFQSR